MSRFSRRPMHSRRGGFTLVELLVSVALVVLMMMMFAEIFSLASNAVSTQKGAAVNDQKVRTFTTLLNNDIRARTFKTVMPFGLAPANTTARARYALDFAKVSDDRRGYFSISENIPGDPTDDVLAFTIKVNEGQYGYRDAMLFGRSGLASDKGGASDHPEMDDGVPADGRGGSSMAEVAYFLRNGNLCRTVMLIREPFEDGAKAGADDQPSEPTPPNVGADLFDSTEAQFWRDFDFSAFRHPTTSQVKFHTSESLNNGLAGSGLMLLLDGSNVPPSLGIPHLRWGHTINGNSGNGIPDEYVDGTFIGRFLRQEMADPDFEYPGINAASPAEGATWNANKGLVAPYDDMSLRRGEEILVPYVHEFDIQVWDDGMTPPGWTDLGAGGGGFYDSTSSPYGNRFDTWHPQLGDEPPYRPFLKGRDSPDGMPGLRYRGGTEGDDDGDGIYDFADAPPANGVMDSGEEDLDEEGWIGTDDERPLRQIRIRVRFYDVKSGQVRQLTLVLPLTEPNST